MARPSFSIRFWLKLWSIVFGILMVFVWEYTEALQLERQIKPLHKEVDRLMYENARLQSQVNQFLSPSHLEEIALKQLNMVPVDNQHRIGIEK